MPGLPEAEELVKASLVARGWEVDFHLRQQH